MWYNGHIYGETKSEECFNDNNMEVDKVYWVQVCRCQTDILQWQTWSIGTSSVQEEIHQHLHQIIN